MCTWSKNLLKVHTNTEISVIYEVFTIFETNKLKTQFPLRSAMVVETMSKNNCETMFLLVINN